MSLRKHLPKLTRFNPFLMMFYALVVGGGSYFIIMSHAATPPPNPPTTYLTSLAPATQTLPINTTFTVSVRENSGSTLVNGVQANITYPASLVDFVSIDSTTSAFGIEAQATGVAGQINIARGTNTTTGPVSGDQLVAIVTFKTKTVGGNAALAFNAGTALVSSVTNQDILGSLSVTAGISYVIDATAPTVSVTSPLTGSTLSGGSVVPIAITASDNSTVSSVDVYIDGTLKSTLTTAPYSYNWSTTGLTLASHTILAKANDPYGNTGSSAVISVTLVDQIAPTVSITSPSAASTATGSVTINATSTDNVGGTGVNRVEFYVDGTLKSTDLTSPYSYVWDSKTVLDGAHTLTAKSYDNAATPNSTTSSAVAVTVDNADHQAPTTPGGLTSSGNTLTAINLSWTASTDNIGVTGYRIQRNGTLMATVTTLAYSDTALASGSTFTYTVSAIDAANNASAPATLSATTLSIKIGDLNGDNIVNITDLSIFLSHWNTTDPVSDIDHNGIVNIFDLSSLLSHYGL